jgi:nitrous oxidase accessory protein NosD
MPYILQLKGASQGTIIRVTIAGIKNVFIQCLVIFTYGNKKPAVSCGLFIVSTILIFNQFNSLFLIPIFQCCYDI